MNKDVVEGGLIKKITKQKEKENVYKWITCKNRKVLWSISMYIYIFLNVIK